MQFKKTVVAVALGLGFVVSAQAATTNLGILDFDKTLSFSYDPYKDFLGVDRFTGESFTNVYSFSVADALHGVAFLATDGWLSLIGDITDPGAPMRNVTFSVFKGSDTSGTALLEMGFGGIVKGEFLFDATDIYTIVVTGTLHGKGIGGYGFNLTAAQAVPEPAEYAMLLAGLGLVGMVARRRKMTVN